MGRLSGISKRDAIALVVAAQGPDVLSRSGARSVLGLWVRRGSVRTKDGEWPVWAKRPRQLYRRADVARQITARDVSRWTAAEDALLGTDIDEAVGRKLRRPGHVVEWRRRKLRIPAHGAGGGRCNPSSWRRAPDDPRLEPPASASG
jgi:hypothetical protein